MGIAQVAERAGVSAATVSRALRGSPSVAEATREKVRKAALALGYAPSAHAAALAGGRSNAIGVVAPWVSRWFFSTVIGGINEVVASHGLDVLMYPIGPDTRADRAQFDALGLHKRVDGVIGLALPYELRVANTLSHLPLVTVGTSSDGIAGVQVDDTEVGYLATRHLVGLGHRRIAFAGLDPQDLYGFRVADDRYAGHCAALHDAGLEADPSLVVTTGFEVEGGEAAFAELLARADWQPNLLPTAVVAVSDEVAIGLIYAARQYGVRVPDDLSIVGVDDHDMARLFDLTTVAQPVIEQGRIAATVLLEMIAHPTAPRPGVRRLAPGLIVRRSTTGPRSR